MSSEPVPQSRRQRLYESMRPWYEIWWSAVSRPGKATYDEIVRDARIDPNRAFLWIILTSLACGILSVLTRQAVYNFHGQPATPGLPSIQQVGLGPFLVSFLVVLVETAVLYPIIILATTMLIHLIANLLGGRAPFRTFLFVFAASYLPIILLSAVLQPIPVVQYVSFIASFYGAILLVYATRAAYSLGTGRALAVSVLTATVVLATAAALASFITLR